MKRFIFLCIFLCISACSHQQQKQQPVVFSPTQPTSLAQVMRNATQNRQSINFKKAIEKPIPIAYQNRLSQSSHQQQVNAYKTFLKTQHLDDVVPDFELFQSARDWQKCSAPEFEVPPREVWANIVPTLNILKRMVQSSILDDFTVTSVYRNFNLNRCAGGANSSRHVFNAALDFRIGSEQPTIEELIKIQQSKMNICKFWATHGEALNMGLGVYASGQIHIDSTGYRTWSPDHRSSSSPCMTSAIYADKR